MIVVTKGHIDVADETVKDLFITAFEGACTYWAEVEGNPAGVGQGAPSERWWAWLVAGNGMDIYDREEPTEQLGTVTILSIETALQLMHDEEPEHFENIVEDSWDAETADVLLQLACMGEITYG